MTDTRTENPHITLEIALQIADSEKVKDGARIGLPLSGALQVLATEVKRLNAIRDMLLDRINQPCQGCGQ